MPENNKTTIDISASAILKVVGVFLALWFIYLIRDILIIIFVAILMSSALDPAVKFLQKNKIPRVLGIVLIYICIFFILFIALFLLIPPLTEQIGQLSQNFPYYWDKLSASFLSIRQYSEEHGFLNNIKDTLNSLQTTFSSSAGNIFNLIGTIFGGIISFVLIFVLTFYFLVQEDAVRRTLCYLTPVKYQAYIDNLAQRMQARVGHWLRGELILAIIIGSMSFIGLWLLGIKFFLVLALIAGISELIPYIGPVIGAIPAVFIAFTQSPWKALSVVLLYWAIQQAENHLIFPKVMQKAVGLNPIVVIIVILIGAKLAGFLGVLLAVPTAAALSVLIRDFFESSEGEIKNNCMLNNLKK